MRNLILSLLLLFLAAPALSAADPAPHEGVEPEAVPSVAVEPEPDAGAEMHLDEVAVDAPAAVDDAGAAQLGPRGGFWWTVGVIVVAGVILAMLL